MGKIITEMIPTSNIALTKIHSVLYLCTCLIVKAMKRKSNFFESYRKLPADERRRRTENEYISELRTEVDRTSAFSEERVEYGHW